MFDRRSRYHGLEVSTFSDSGGGEIAYVSRRLRSLNGEDAPFSATVREGDRLDLMSARVLGDPESYWRLCDANQLTDPLDLCLVPGRRIRSPLPE